jgi:hypothetical protein
MSDISIPAGAPNSSWRQNAVGLRGISWARGALAIGRASRPHSRAPECDAWNPITPRIRGHPVERAGASDPRRSRGLHTDRTSVHPVCPVVIGIAPQLSRGTEVIGRNACNLGRITPSRPGRSGIASVGRASSRSHYSQATNALTDLKCNWRPFVNERPHMTRYRKAAFA